MKQEGDIQMTESTVNEQPKLMPLEGIRVVEFGTFHAGPGASAILGDLGAEAIKIEEASGDPMRGWDEVSGIDMKMPNGEALPFEYTNRNKRSLCLDIKKEKGRKIFHQLIQGADVFITNLRKSTKTTWGIDYASLSRINPRIIHASVSGFGPSGPVSDLGAFDPMGQARSGMMFVAMPDRPAVIHLAVLDQATSIALSHAIITALFVRERSGTGQEVHVSLYSAALWLLSMNLMMTGCIGVDPVPLDRCNYAPLRNYFRCKDGKWIIGSHHPEEKYWPALFKATGQTALLKDSRFADASGMRKHRAALVEHFDKVFAARPRDEWLPILRQHGLMFGPVQRMPEVLTDPQSIINEYVVDFNHPTMGQVKIPGYPIHFSHCQAGTRSAAPGIGEHTAQIMRELGYSDREISNLKKTGVIQ